MIFYDALKLPLASRLRFSSVKHFWERSAPCDRVLLPRDEIREGRPSITVIEMNEKPAHPSGRDHQTKPKIANTLHVTSAGGRGGALDCRHPRAGHRSTGPTYVTVKTAVRRREEIVREPVSESGAKRVLLLQGPPSDTVSAPAPAPPRARRPRLFLPVSHAFHFGSRIQRAGLARSPGNGCGGSGKRDIDVRQL
ncbi:hypothetical protein EVAR_37245_1 [Eumeta japonica]|uniref:Uncharacterized protein n=1 Tax=Eumeta variegata TaxID=151549 RepID=A0A4C1Y6M2_EUMVA|nr:hypothetical protein EVAR_37245_1 [Eumeta japonica]